jgi:hypothetical protein
MSQIGELASDAILQLDIFGEPGDGAGSRRRGRGAVEPGGNTVIGELCAIVHRGLINIRSGQRTIRAKNHLNDDREAVDGEVQRGEIGR